MLEEFDCKTVLLLEPEDVGELARDGGGEVRSVLESLSESGRVDRDLELTGVPRCFAELEMADFLDVRDCWRGLTLDSDDEIGRAKEGMSNG